MQGISRVEYLGYEDYVSPKTGRQSLLMSYWDGNSPSKAKLLDTKENRQILATLNKMETVLITYTLEMGKYTTFNILTVEREEK